MTNNVVGKTIIILLYAMIIIMIPLFLDYLFMLTVRKKRKNQILELAKNKSLETNKPIIVFNDRYHGVVIDEKQKMEKFDGDIVEIINQMAENSCVIVISQTLEYIDNDKLEDTILQLNNVSGGDLYCVNIEKNSPRVFWDYKIKNIMDKSFYLPHNDITWVKPNQLQENVQKVYSYIFKILPYQLFTNDPIIKI